MSECTLEEMEDSLTGIAESSLYHCIDNLEQAKTWLLCRKRSKEIYEINKKICECIELLHDTIEKQENNNGECSPDC